MCSYTCRSRWEHIRANVYQVLVSPLRAQPELDTIAVLEEKVSRIDHEHARTLLIQGNVAYQRFLRSLDPIGWIKINLAEHEHKILGDS